MSKLDFYVGKGLTLLTLLTVPALPTVQFKNFKLRSADLKIAALLIASGRVKFRTTQQYTSSYNDQNAAGSNANRLMISIDLASLSLPTSANIVHEACHIVFDYRKMKGQASASEAVAYVCQAMYHVKTMNTPFTHNSAAANKIFVAAQAIGDKALAGKTPTLQNWNALEKIILRHPIYVNRGRGLKQVISDGIP